MSEKDPKLQHAESNLSTKAQFAESDLGDVSQVETPEMANIADKEESKHLEGLSREGSSSPNKEEEPLGGALPADFESTGKAGKVGGDDGPAEEPAVEEEEKPEEKPEEKKVDPQEERKQTLATAIEFKTKGTAAFKSAKGPEDFEAFRNAREEYYNGSRLLIHRRQEF